MTRLANAFWAGSLVLVVTGCGSTPDESSADDNGTGGATDGVVHGGQDQATGGASTVGVSGASGVANNAGVGGSSGSSNNGGVNGGGKGGAGGSGGKAGASGSAGSNGGGAGSGGGGGVGGGGGSSGSTPKIGDTDSKGRKLTWADEFNGPAIDRSVWGSEVGFLRNNELQKYTTDAANQYIENGELVIKGIYVGGTGQGSFTSASLTTQGHKTFQYGRIEARMKAPAPKGSWPAFWLIPPNKGWPEGGEIDIMEYVSQSPNTVWGTAHYAVNGQHQSSQGTQNLSSSVPSGYHVYAVEWTDKRVDWYVDDKMYFGWDYSKMNPGPDGNAFNGSFFIILNYAIGGAWPEAPDSSQYPGQMRVDWVRVWQ